jgi:hypothetical protein
LSRGRWTFPPDPQHRHRNSIPSLSLSLSFSMRIASRLRFTSEKLGIRILSLSVEFEFLQMRGICRERGGERERERERELESLLNSVCLSKIPVLLWMYTKTRSPCAGKRLTDARRERVGDGQARCQVWIGRSGVKGVPSGFLTIKIRGWVGWGRRWVMRSFLLLIYICFGSALSFAWIRWLPS